MYSLSEYFNFAKNIYNARGSYGVYKEGTSYVYETFLRQISPLLDNDSEYVLDKDWDVLIILDACTVEALEEVADEYEFLPDPPHDTIWSAGSYSEGWMRKNFTGEQKIKHRKRIKNLVHVSGNPFTDSVFDGDEFKILDEVWRYGWDDEEGYMPPEPITDRAITHYREHNPDQMLVHYMQPHAPFISDTKTSDYHIDTAHFASPKGSVKQRTPWELLRDGVLSQEDLWDAYIDTLRVGLDSVRLLLNNIDAEKVVISADHGNSMGELGIYGHPRDMPVSSIRRVPWVTTSATNNESHSVDSDETLVQEAREDADVQERLNKLGYS